MAKNLFTKAMKEKTEEAIRAKQIEEFIDGADIQPSQSVSHEQEVEQEAKSSETQEEVKEVKRGRGRPKSTIEKKRVTCEVPIELYNRIYEASQRQGIPMSAYMIKTAAKAVQDELGE